MFNYKKYEDVVEKVCKSEKNYFGYRAWDYHVKPVIKYSQLLAKKLGANEETVTLAAIFHDYAGLLDKKYYDKHHVLSAKFAEEILLQDGYSKDKIDKIKHCILTHRGSRQDKRTTIEAEILASADAMSHFDYIFSLLYLAYAIHKMDEDEGREWVWGKLKRSWEKLMPEAKEMVKEKYKIAKRVLVV